MSFILDALKKSEAERQRRAGPALLEMRVVRPKRGIPAWVLIGGGVLLLVNLLGLLWLLIAPDKASEAARSTPSPDTSTVTALNPLPAAVVATVTPPGATTVGGVQAGSASDAPYIVAGDDTLADEVSAADRAPAIVEAGTAPASRLRHYSELAGDLPALRLDFHVYSPNAAERYAFINMHKVREGETTAEGLRVLAITRAGVELSYRNSDFLLSSEQR